jgi:hypothetical protein|tara:strand:+ start:2481 stop:3638 length:1158 start_codon:yes stop_codon:yes gene_type:complete
MPLQPTLQVRLYNNNLSTPTLIEDLTDKVEGLNFSTALNGGFRTCSFILATDLGYAWNYLSREGKRGYHFNRITVHEEQRLVWEGRIVDIELNIMAARHNLKIVAHGYWGSMKDQFYSDDAGTDWTSGSGHQMHDIIKEVLDDECPDINSDQTNIEDSSRDLVGIDFSAKEYPQDIVNKLTDLSDDDGSVWFFAIWDDRKPYFFKRSITKVDYYVWLEDVSDLKLQQSATQLRNVVLPFVGTTEGTTQTDATSLALYPRRESKLSVNTGANANTQADAAGTAAVEKSLPRQQQNFSINGRIYSAVAGDAGARMEEVPLWRVRSGDVIRIQDLVPSSSATATLDDVRTFYVMETEYDADKNILKIQPDRRKRSLARTIAKLGNLEK